MNLAHRAHGAYDSTRSSVGDDLACLKQHTQWLGGLIEFGECSMRHVRVCKREVLR